MEAAETAFYDLVEKVRSWIPRRAESSAMSRDFWMPDSSCRVCYECDSQFSLFNRRHHCRNCGRVFCWKCTQHTLPAVDGRRALVERERVRVCNYCFKLRQQDAANQSAAQASSPSLSRSSSRRSSASTSTSSSSTASSSGHPGFVAAGSRPRRLSTDGIVPSADKNQDMMSGPRRRSSRSVSPFGRDQSPSPYDFCNNRSDGNEGELHKERDFHNSRLHTSHEDDEDDDSCVEMDLADSAHKFQPDNLSPQHTENYRMKETDFNDERHQVVDADRKNSSYQSVCTIEQSPSRRCGMSSEDYEGADESVDDSNFYTPLYQEPSPPGEQPVDIEKNASIWVPPPPEDEEEEAGIGTADDEQDDDDGGGWGFPRSSGSLSGSECRSREKAAADEQRKAMRAVVDGHFRALVAQLLNAEGIETEGDDKESWVEILTTLSLQAASSVKPDTSRGGGMDPGGYLKVKCIATGRRSESSVVKGVVCKKNVAHKRMTSRYRNPRLLLLGGALEYQRVANQLSSFDTLLQQERDHLSMTVARIEAHHPNVLLVEKSVSRQAQDRLLAKEISLVLNVKRPLLERVARCTGAQIVLTPDHLTAAKAGHCDLFHVEKYLEEHGSAGQAGKKLIKNLMFFEGCPKPLGCTVLLKGANGDELKKVKRVLQLAVFAAYHLALETSFLVDEGASLPELPLKSPVTVTLPPKQSKSDRSISMIPGFFIPAPGHTQTGDIQTLQSRSNMSVSPHPVNLGDSGMKSFGAVATVQWSANSSYISSTTNSPGTSPQFIGLQEALAKNSMGYPPTTRTLQSSLHDVIGLPSGQASSALKPGHPELGVSGMNASLKMPSSGVLSPSTAYGQTLTKLAVPSLPSAVAVDVDGMDVASETYPASYIDMKVGLALVSTETNAYNLPHLSLTMESQDGSHLEDQEFNQEDFPPSPSNHQSILVSLSTSCLRKGTVCERGQLLRINYYGSFDKPLGRFLRDTVFDLKKRCVFCDEPRDAHLHCYTHRQGNLTISVQHQNKVLPGGKEGKIWMWHRCLKCTCVNGVPPATRRIVMSDAAWGLSFGKFLELSFSNHAAASRVAACGHSLHRDCLRFYGFGGMVACFRYAPINVHSVYLPPSKLEFNNPEQQDWLRKEVDEVADKGELMFAENFDSLRQIGEKIASFGSGKVPEARRRIGELEALLQKDKSSFEEALQKAAPMKCQQGQLVADILELNFLRRNLAMYSVQWDQCLRYLVSSLKLWKSTTGSESMPFNGPSISFAKDINSRSIVGGQAIGNQETQATENYNLDNSEISQTESALATVKMGVVHSGVTVQCKGQFRITKPDITEHSGLDNVVCTANYPPPLNRLSETNSINGKVECSPICGTLLEEEDFLSLKSMDIAKNTDTSVVESSFGAEHTQLCISSNMIDSTLGSTEGQFPVLQDLSDTFEAALTGKVCEAVEVLAVHTAPNSQEIIVNEFASDTNFRTGDTDNGAYAVGSDAVGQRLLEQSNSKPVIGGSPCLQERGSLGSDLPSTSNPTSPAKPSEQSDGLGGRVGGSFSSLHRFYGKGLHSSLTEFSPRTEFSGSTLMNAGQLAAQGGGRILLPLGICDTVIAVYDDEPTSIIAYAITSQEYKAGLSNRSAEKDKQHDKDKEREQRDKLKEKERDVLIPELIMSHPLQSVETSLEQGETTLNGKKQNSDENFIARLKEVSLGKPLLYSEAVHVKVPVTDDAPQGKIQCTVTCYYAKQFDALRKKCCPSEMDFVRSLCRCKKWGAQGGKSNVFFAKTADDRFVIKQVTKTELESFMKFAPEYFKYLSDALNTGSPTCLAKILGIFQVTMKHGKGGKEVRLELMAMENLLYGRHVTQVYDLKGSSRSRYNADATGKNKVLLDENLLESMQTNPIFIGNKAKRLLERAVWNDTHFLASIDVMDYSLLVGVDEERRELVLGIIDFIRQYTWDKHLETWVKASGILGGPKNVSPTVISPKEYKKRFRKAMNTYFLMVPDQWSPPMVVSGPPEVETANQTRQVAPQDEDV